MADHKFQKDVIGSEHPWDEYSDQPAILRDKSYKKKMKSKQTWEHLLTLLTAVVLFPVLLLASFFNRKKEPVSEHFFSLCVNLDKGEEQYALVEELGCQSIQVRFFLAEIEKIDEYYRFLEGFSDKQILLVVVQSRVHIEDPELLAADMHKVFTRFSPLISQFQIGTTINRSKWGFFSVGEYLRFYKVVQGVRDQYFQQLCLTGPSVIDFEYPYLIRALFNGYRVSFDKLSALLYVDRRGAPENPQMLVFDTYAKIRFLHSIARLSNKSTSKLLLTEANWPLEKTAPWAPTSETECVNETDYANYMLRYYLQALASGCVESVYWHQLIANGYGLVDGRDGLRRREAFYVFKTMLSVLQSAEVQSFEKNGDVFDLLCFDPDKKQNIRVLWCNATQLALREYAEKAQIALEETAIIDKVSNRLDREGLISDSPIYILGDSVNPLS